MKNVREEEKGCREREERVGKKDGKDTESDGRQPSCDLNYRARATRVFAAKWLSIISASSKLSNLRTT